MGANLWLTALCGLAFVGCAQGGGLVLRRLVPLPEATGALALAALGGLSLAGFVACAVGFAPVPLPPYTEALAAQPCLAGLFFAAGALGLGLWAWQRPWRRWQRPCLPAALTAGTLAILAVWTLLPPTLVDESLYHLSLPLQYLRHGGFVVVPGHANSGFPQFGEMLSLWPLSCASLSGARLPQVVTMALGCGALVQLLPDMPPRHVWWACWLMLLTPIVTVVLPSSHIDVGESVYALVGILCLHRFAVTQEAGLLGCGAWLLGCAAATKYLALALLPFGLLVVLLALQAWSQRGTRLPSPRALAAALVLGALPVAPWLGRNWMAWHNPLFPFAIDLFPASAQALSVEQRVTIEAFMQRFGPMDGDTSLYGPWALVRLPFDLLFRARFDRMAFDGVIGPLCLAVAAIHLVARLRRRAARRITASRDGSAPRRASRPRATGAPSLAGPDAATGGPPSLVYAYAAFAVVVWLSTSWQMRFLIAPYWAVCLALPGGLAALGRGWLQRGAALVCAVCVVSTWPATARKMPAWDRRMLDGPEAAHALRLAAVPWSAACDVLDGTPHAASDRTLMVWTQRLCLWCNTALYSDSYDEAASLNAWLMPAPGDTLRALRDHGITHLLVNEQDLLEAPPGGVGEQEAQRLHAQAERYQALVPAMQRQATAGPVTLYALPRATPP